MQIQIHTDHNVEGDESLTTHARDVVAGALDRFSKRLTHVEVHLGDEKGDNKFGRYERRCTIEARLAGHQPTVVTDHATSLHEAIAGASSQIVSALESLLARLGHR